MAYYNPGWGQSTPQTPDPSTWWKTSTPNVSQTRTPTTPNLPVNAIPTPSSIGALGNLSTQINNMLLAGTKAAQNARIPGGAALEAASSKVIGSELAGAVPDDVINLLKQQGAEAGVGGTNPQAAYLRALGLTSLDQIKSGETNLSAADARNPAAPIFDPATQLLTPNQSGNLALGVQRQNLDAQAEADRVAMENARLALEAARLTPGGGGGGGQVTNPTVPGAGLPNYGGGVYTTAGGEGFTPSTAGSTYMAQDPLYWEDVFGPGTSAEKV